MTDRTEAAGSGPDLGAVLGRAGAGESFAAIRRSLTPAEWAPVVARAAVAGRFDEELYGRVLAADTPQGPTLEVLTDVGLAEPVPGRPGWYALPADDRAVWSAELPEGDALRLESQLAAEYLNRGDDLEALAHLLVVDLCGGLELLEKLFDEADGNLDLPRCRDILNAARLDERSLGSAVANVVAERAAYLNARVLWMPDYYQSALFMPPPGLQERADELLNGKRRVWQLVGQGGVGKTMQLRWLAARRWVPRPSPTACARIDYDALDPVMCARYPFLTLLLVAEQLAPQLTRNPFSTLLRTYSAFLALTRYGSRGRDDIDHAEAQLAGETVPALFIEACAAVGKGPVVVILDTLEELSLRYPTETAALIDRLADVAAATPALRLVFTGRYAVPAVRDRFPELLDIPVKAFDDEQANAYLATVRGIRDERRRADLVRRSGGLPFVLALYGDLVTQDPDIVLEDVHEREPQLVYLVDRVIDRIREPLVRWLLRYGSIPRRLTRDYVLKVLAPFVVRSQSGDHSLDDPMLDPIVEWYGRRLFPTDLPDLQSQLGRAWDDLGRYVSTSSWVNPAMGEQTAETYVLKAEVLGPMRAILADRPVLQQLHLESARFYLAQAEQNGARRTLHLRDAVYHFAQAGADGLADLWRSMVDNVREAGDHLGLADLCAEITGPEYVDETGHPVRRRDGGPLVEEGLVVEAHVWRAYAAQAVAVRWRLPGKDPRWSEALRELGDAGRVAGDLGAWVARLPRSRRGLLEFTLKVTRAALVLRDGDAAGASALVEGWQQQTGDVAVSAGLIEAQLISQAHGDDIAALEQVTSKALDSGNAPDAAAACSVLADRLVGGGEVDQAVRWVGRTADATGELRDRYLRLLTQEGRPKLAASLPQPPSETLTQGLARQRAKAEAVLALRRPDLALDLLETSMRQISDELQDPNARLREQAESLGIMGQALGAVLRLDEAVKAFERATDLLRDLGYPHGALRNHRRHVEVLLHEAGDVLGALQLLEDAAPQLDDGQESARIWLLLAEARSRAGDEEAGRRLVADVLGSASGPRPPYRRRAMAAIGGMVATGDAERYAGVLVESLAHVQPVTAQLHLLDNLRWASPAHLESGVRPLLDTVLAPTDGPAEEEAVHDLQRAYALRALGAERSDEARARLESAVALSTSPFLAWEAMRHFGPDAPESAFTASEGLDASLGGLVMSAVRVLRAAARNLSDQPDLGMLEDRVAEAKESFDRGASRSAWPAEALSLRAVIAALDQRPAVAQEHLDEAVARYRRLGDLRRATAVAGQVAQLSSTTAPTQVREGRDPRTGELIVQTDLPHQVLATVADASSTSLSIMRVLHPDVALPVGAEEVVRVESAGPLVLALPWEQVAARVYRSLPRELSIERDHAWLHWAGRLEGTSLPEADAWVLTARPLPTSLRLDVEDRLPRRLGARRGVLVVKARREVESSWGGYSSHGRGLDLSASYRDRGWEVTEVDADKAATIDIARMSPLIVHVQARLEVSGGSGWFDLSPEDRGARTVRKASGAQTSIFDSDLLKWLEPLKERRGHPPVVVLDPVVPPQSGDMAPLLTARNRLAASVYYDGMTMAVVAAGLIDYGDPELVQDAWLGGLEAGMPLLEVTTRMRRFADERAPVALFAPSATFRLAG